MQNSEKFPVRVRGPIDSQLLPLDDYLVINTTSRSKEKWSTGLSPFFLGPVELYDGYSAQNVENAWQYCKVYKCHTDEFGNPTDEYWKWAKKGWASKTPTRFPMKRGAKPEYALWKGQYLDYIQARKQIYAKLYSECVEKSIAFQKLKKLYEEKNGKICLFDFDGYDHVYRNKSLREVINDPNMIMGHAFILTMLLEGKREWEN